MFGSLILIVLLNLKKYCILYLSEFEFTCSRREEATKRRSAKKMLLNLFYKNICETVVKRRCVYNSPKDGLLLNYFRRKYHLNGYLWHFQTTRFNIKTLPSQKLKSNKNRLETGLLLKVPWKTLNSNLKVALH